MKPVIIDEPYDEEEETAEFVEKYVREMMPRMQYLTACIQSGRMSTDALLSAQQEIFRGFALLYAGLPPHHQEKFMERLAPQWRTLTELTERNRAIARRQARRAAHG
jgi:hypothetical protein